VRGRKMSNSTFGFEKPEHSPGFLLWQTTMTWQRLIKKALDVYDISHAQFVVLAVTLWFEEKKQNPTQILIARLSKLDKMTVSKSLKKLVSLGLIKRTEHEKDTRAKSIYLTPKGRAMAEKLVPIVEKIDYKFFAIEQKDRQKLINTLAMLIKQVKV
jgi:DNA-binding MarR family transcriptional regulator